MPKTDKNSFLNNFKKYYSYIVFIGKIKKRCLLQMVWKLIGVITALMVVLTRGDPVYILSENMQQMITSTSLQWVPADKQSKIDFQDAVIGAHQEIEGE